jgi:hypothetical protein
VILHSIRSQAMRTLGDEKVTFPSGQFSYVPVGTFQFFQLAGTANKTISPALHPPMQYTSLANGRLLFEDSSA